MSTARTANLLGALALALSDEIRSAAERQVTHGGSAPAALSLIGHEPGLSIDELARMLGMSHPGAVRLVQRLDRDRLIARKPTRDGRTSALQLTAAGRKRRARLLAERRTVLEGALKRLSAQERVQLAALLKKLLVGLKRDALHAYAICRFCEETVCQRCPMAEG